MAIVMTIAMAISVPMLIPLATATATAIVTMMLTIALEVFEWAITKCKIRTNRMTLRTYPDSESHLSDESDNEATRDLVYIFPSITQAPVHEAEAAFIAQFPGGYMVTHTPGDGNWCLLFAIHRSLVHHFPGLAPSLLELYRAYRQMVQESALIQGGHERDNFRADHTGVFVSDWVRSIRGQEVRIGVLRRVQAGQ